MTDTAYEAITITNEIHTGAAFGILHGTGRNCYIPSSVIHASRCRPGDVVDAVLVENPNPDPDIRNRTPYMVRFIKPPVGETPPAAPQRPVQLELPLEPETPSQLAREIIAKLGGEAPAPAPVPSLKERATKHVEATMAAGGVWRFATMFADFMRAEGKPGADRARHMDEYWAVAHAMRHVFDTDRCAKWTLYSKASNQKASKEWYSCHPHTIDVAEFEDE